MCLSLEDECLLVTPLVLGYNTKLKILVHLWMVKPICVNPQYSLSLIIGGMSVHNFSKSPEWFVSVESQPYLFKGPLLC